MRCSRALLPLVASACALAAQQEDANEQIRKIEAALTKITGLKFSKPVPSAFIDKTRLHAFLEERMKEAVKPKDVHAQEVTLKMLGFLPDNFDLKKATIELLTEQAAAFYDYHKKKLFIIETGVVNESAMGGEATEMALSHELAHALADQNFHLDKYIREGMRSDDAAAARLAVMEGQASWLMSAYLSLQATGSANVPASVLELMTHALEGSAQQYPVFAKAPLYLRESLVFPYTAGMLFQNTLFEKLDGQGFAAPFRRPPDSTQQILHPEKYLDRVEPQIPKVPEIPNRRESRALSDGTLGEFDYRVLLKQYASKEDAESLAPHLTGSAYEVRENKRDQRPAMALASNWDTPETARKFFEQYRKIVVTKSKGAIAAPESAEQAFGSNGAGYFRIRLHGSCVDSVEGSPAQLH